MNIKQENFKRISDNRTNKIIDLISKLHNLINPSFYEYTDDEIDNMFNRIQEELDKQRIQFINNRSKTNKRVKL